jgi:hypothetical protein
MQYVQLEYPGECIDDLTKRKAKGEEEATQELAKMVKGGKPRLELGRKLKLFTDQYGYASMLIFKNKPP